MCLIHSTEIDKLAAALAKAQGLIEDASKDGKNPAFKQGGKESKYANLSNVRDAIRMPLSANGLSYVQFPEADGQKVSCETMLMHETGQWIRGKLTMTATQATPQGIGSAITYCRRYSLMAVIGIAPDDDDGNAASEAPPKREPAPRTTRGQEDMPRNDYDQTPFDDFPGDVPKPEKEPVISTAAINIGRELRACKTMPMLVELWTSERIKAFYKAAHAVDRKSIEGAKDAQKAVLNDADLLAAG